MAASRQQGSWDGPLRARLIAAADDVIAGYRNSSSAALDRVDWEKAILCLRRAQELQPSAELAGKEALCAGYIRVLRNSDGAKADFERAANLAPRLPDPHLALGRVEIYTFHNVGEALAQFQEAERLGYRLGPKGTSRSPTVTSIAPSRSCANSFTAITCACCRPPRAISIERTTAMSRSPAFRM